MKGITSYGKLLCLALTLLLVLGIAAPGLALAAETGGLRYTVSVAKFENRAGWHGQWDLGDAWGLVLTDILNQTGRFIVLGEKDMRSEAMAEQDFAASGRTAQGDKTPVVGQMTPAQILVKGAITHVQENTSNNMGGIAIGGVVVGGGKKTAQVNVTMYMIDTTTGQVLASTSVVGKSDSSSTVIGYAGHGWGAGYANFQNSNVGKAVENAVSQGVQWMIGQLPKVQWRGAVVMVKDGQVYINRGSREGVTAGQVFLVGQADIIRDPSTGEVLDQSVNEVARIQVVTVREKLSICEVINGNSSSITQGMMIQKP